MCFDGVKRLCHIRGKPRSPRCWVTDVWKPCALMESSVSVISVESSERRFGSISRTSSSLVSATIRMPRLT